MELKDYQAEVLTDLSTYLQTLPILTTPTASD
jgi:hypothetical protein